MTDSLATLFAQHGTDKLGHGYAGLYECLFGERRYRIMRFLEVGIGTVTPGANFTMAAHPNYRPGASLRAWRDWLPNALIYGMDPQADCMIADEPRIVTMLCDSTNSLSATTFMGTVPGLLDVIVDDGSHWPADQLATLTNLWPYLRPGGTYVIEDLLDDQFWADRGGITAVVGEAPHFFARFAVHNVLVTTKPG
jgi:hypothetical protein